MFYKKEKIENVNNVLNDFFLNLQKKIPWNPPRSEAVEILQRERIKNVNNVLTEFFLKITIKDKKNYYLEVPEPKRFYKKKR